MYRLNVKKPRQSAVLHRAVSSDRRCQPQRKKPSIGYWGNYETVHDVRVEAASLKLKLRSCAICSPVMGLREARK